MTKTCPVCDGPLDSAGATCPFCGFNLTQATQQFTPVAVEEGASLSTPRTPQKSSVLQVFKGPQVGLVFTLDNTTQVIGRDPNNDIFLNDMTVSRSHATIEPAGTTYRIVDTNSFNGVWVNGTNVSSTVLKSGDIVQIGAFSLIFNQQ